MDIHLWSVTLEVWTPAVAQEGAFLKWDDPLSTCGDSSAISLPAPQV